MGGNGSAKRVMISIHAPREGGDYGALDALVRQRNFNPRPPRGGRLPTDTNSHKQLQISIHAPREGGDRAHPNLT